MRPQVDDLFSRDDAAAERMKKRFPDLDKLQALGKAVRDAKDADDQLIKLTAYCSQLTRTRSERTEHQRFSGIKLHFSTIEKFNELTPQLFPERSRQNEVRLSDLAFAIPTGLASALRHRGGPQEPIEMLFHPADAALVGKLTTLQSSLDALFAPDERLTPAPESNRTPESRNETRNRKRIFESAKAQMRSAAANPARVI